MSPVRAVLMEFDGVLADTTRQRIAVLRDVLGDAGLDMSDDQVEEMAAGSHPDETARAAAAQWCPQLDETARDLLVLRAERAYSAAIREGVVLRDGARGAIERLAGGARIGLVSRLRHADLQALLALGSMEDFFMLVIGADDVGPRKPSPAPYRAAMDRLQGVGVAVGAGDVLALEDCQSGIRSARAAGVRCLAVGPLPVHVAIEADGWLPSLSGHDVASLWSVLEAGNSQ